MSFTRSKFDDCAYQKELNENQNVLHYNLDANKFYNCNPTRIDFGLLGGNNVSQSSENLVDVESELRNQNRLYSRCPRRKFRPTCNVLECGNANGYPCGDAKCQPKMHHMKDSTMIDYRPRYNNIGYNLEGVGCGTNPTMWAHKPNQTQVNNAAKYAQGPVGGNKIPFAFKTV